MIEKRLLEVEAFFRANIDAFQAYVTEREAGTRWYGPVYEIWYDYLQILSLGRIAGTYANVDDLLLLTKFYYRWYRFGRRQSDVI